MTASTTMTSSPRLAPPLEGVPAARHRLYTIEHLPFGALPEFAAGGPCRTQHTRWLISYDLPGPRDIDRGATVNACVVDERGIVEIHPLHGTRHASLLDAERAAFDAGLTAYLVYEDHAARYGLPATPESGRGVEHTMAEIVDEHAAARVALAVELRAQGHTVTATGKGVDR